MLSLKGAEALTFGRLQITVAGCCSPLVQPQPISLHALNVCWEPFPLLAKVGKCEARQEIELLQSVKMTDTAQPEGGAVAACTAKTEGRVTS